MQPEDYDDLYSLMVARLCLHVLHGSEGFGLIIAEAMMRGLLVVAINWVGN